MTELIIPVKILTDVKQRLADVLTPSQRASLVLAMLQDLLETVPGIPKVTTWVVSNDEQVLKLAKRFGCRTLKEPTVEGHNSAVAFGMRALKEYYKNDVNVALVPADVPLASCADLSALTRAANPDTATIRLVPSHDEGGTNGIFLSSCNLMCPSFGEDSFQRHQRMCRDADIVPEIVALPTLAHDIDTPIDLARLKKHHTPGAAVNYLNSLSDDYTNHVIQ